LPLNTVIVVVAVVLKGEGVKVYVGFLVECLEGVHDLHILRENGFQAFLSHVNVVECPITKGEFIHKDNTRKPVV
jgi:protoheme ferro-lyase